METPVLISSLCQPVGLLKTGPGYGISLDQWAAFVKHEHGSHCCLELTDMSLYCFLYDNFMCEIRSLFFLAFSLFCVSPLELNDVMSLMAIRCLEVIRRMICKMNQKYRVTSLLQKTYQCMHMLQTGKHVQNEISRM